MALGFWTFREATDGLGGYLIGVVAGVAGILTGHLVFLLVGLAIALPICLETHRWRHWRAKGLGTDEDDPGRQPYWSHFIFGHAGSTNGSGGGFSGGSAGGFIGGVGGFSGGGGATGSW